MLHLEPSRSSGSPFASLPLLDGKKWPKKLKTLRFFESFCGLQAVGPTYEFQLPPPLLGFPRPAARPTLPTPRADTPFRQQRVKSFLPILQPLFVVGIFLAIGVVFIPLGKWFMDESEEVCSHAPHGRMGLGLGRPLAGVVTRRLLRCSVF